MLSRIAEATFWLARYLERADHVARYLGVQYHFLLEGLGATDGEGAWRSTLDLLGETESFAARGLTVDGASVLDYLVLDPENPSSIRSCLRSARENGRAIRDRISNELWEELNTFHHAVEGADRGVVLAEPHGFLEEVERGIQGLYGVAEATLLHDEGWHLLRTGMFLERAGLTARFLRVRFPELAAAEDPATGVLGPLGSHVGMAILRTVSAYEAYRKISHTRIEAHRVAELLVLSPLFPRSIRFCLTGLDYELRAVRRTPPGIYETPAERIAGRALAECAYVEMDEVGGPFLDGFLERVIRRCQLIGQAIVDVYFIHPPARARTGREAGAVALPR